MVAITVVETYCYYVSNLQQLICTSIKSVFDMLL